jgi:hypothetical protein
LTGALAHRGVERVDGRARHTEGAAHTLALQDEDGGVDRAHENHDSGLPVCGGCGAAGQLLDEQEVRERVLYVNLHHSE